MKISIELSSTQAQRVREEAARIGISPEHFVEAVLKDLLDQPKPEFENALSTVLRKNEELYKRLG